MLSSQGQGIDAIHITFHPILLILIPNGEWTVFLLNIKIIVMLFPDQLSDALTVSQYVMIMINMSFPTFP